jgi:hypothetical protein
MSPLIFKVANALMRVSPSFPPTVLDAHFNEDEMNLVAAIGGYQSACGDSKTR